MQDVVYTGVTTALSLVATSGISELTKTIVNIYIKPKLNELHKESKIKSNLDLIEYKFEDYIKRSYNTYLYMNTLAVKNEQRTINDLYIPLTVKKSNLVRSEDNIEICINKYNDEFITKYKRVLLIDNAGMGKSTIIKYIYLSAINEEKGIPVLIELRKIDKEVTIIDFIMKQINGIKENFSKDDILALIERGDFIFLLDGYDEIKDELKDKVVSSLQEFIHKASNNKFLISSREDSSLSSFGDFQRFEIRPLNEIEAHDLIKKYDNNGELSDELIKILKNEENLNGIKEFLDNPLMVSLLYLAFKYRRDLPKGKHIFYRQVYDALFLDHDKSKGDSYVHSKKSNLNIDDFHKVLRILGFITLKHGVSYSREKLLEYLRKVKEKALELDFKESDFIYDLEFIVPLFLKEGNEYRWCHKSFQEYFAASYIYLDSKENQERILSKIIEIDKIEKYYNVLDFYYDMDYKGFLRTIIYPMINEVDNFYRNSYLSDHYKNFDLEEINLRKALQVKNRKIFIKKINNDERKIICGEKRKELNTYEYFLEGDHQKPYSVISINDEIGVTLYKNYISVLLGLLDDKSSNIIMKVPENIYDFKYETIFQNLIKNGIYEVDDNTKNIINNKKMFKLTNIFIKRNNNEFKKDITLILNYDECMELKEQIEKEIELEKNDIDFL